MAGDWIKMRTDLATDPAVIAIADDTGLDEDSVVGKLHRLWSWADQQTEDGNARGNAKGNARGVTEKWIDRYLGAQGFARAMASAGWLEIYDDGIVFPDFQKHNGQTGKRRALTAKRVATCKAKKGNAIGNAEVTQEALPREEKRRVIEDTSTNVEVALHVPHAAPQTSEFSFPLVSGHIWQMPQLVADQYMATYAEYLDVRKEFAKARHWLMEPKHKARRPKSATGMRKFLTSWLNRADEYREHRANKNPDDIAGKVYNSERGEWVTPLKGESDQ